MLLHYSKISPAAKNLSYIQIRMGQFTGKTLFLFFWVLNSFNILLF